MAHAVINNVLLRKNYSRIGNVLDIPNLIEVQRKLFGEFLQAELKPEERANTGMQAVFKDIFPVKDVGGNASLEFIHYSLGDPKYTIPECRQKGMTYSVPVRIMVQLIVWDKDVDTGVQTIRDIKEQEVYFGEIPMMTENGTFIINGTERVIVSQLHRSPGVFFEQDKAKHNSSRPLYTARVIPYHGSWLDFEFDLKEWIYVKIDKRKKIPATILLKALGYSVEELLNYFYPSEDIIMDKGGIFKVVKEGHLLGKRSMRDILNPGTGEVIVKQDRKFTKVSIRKLKESGVDSISVDFEEIAGSIIAADIVDPSTGEIFVESNQPLTASVFETMKDRGVTDFKLLFMDITGPSLRDTLLNDKITNEETKAIAEYRKMNPDDATTPTTLNARVEIYRRLKPGDLPSITAANKFFGGLFFDSEKYNLSKVGRLKLNKRLGLDTPLSCTTLRREDICRTVKYLVDVKSGYGVVDDIDHLGNRRVRSVGELFENQYRIGLLRMQRAIKERMSLGEIETLMPRELINPKPVSAVVREFFGSSQLSQFTDQTNPLAEITHKRRLSALGPGGLTRERAGFEVRDVHPTHYGRICPIETPEGPNIGLIVSLSTYARVNEFGFIETPYREVLNGRVTEKTRYLSALDEENHIIAQANALLDDEGNFVSRNISARQNREFVIVEPEKVTLMDVSPNQLVSVATALIPFLENDDANRALMGSNMQRQAVPLIKTEAPIVGTGLESVVAHDSGVTVAAKDDGVIENVDGSRIVVRANEGKADIYNLTKFRRSNQNTCLNQKPIVNKGDIVKRGDIIADGASTDNGELALGKNVLVAFMPWGGYNFEDSILLNERLVRDDVFTSVHVEEFEIVARDTKLGKEEITNDIPNVGEHALSKLDDTGVVRIGAQVRTGDILVGKVTPKGETQLSPEEKLLRAIFGEKAEDVRDTSLVVPPGIEGIVIDTQVFSRKGVEKDERAKSIEDKEVARLLKDQAEEVNIAVSNIREKINKILLGKVVASVVNNADGETLLRKGAIFDSDSLKRIPNEGIGSISVLNDERTENRIKELFEEMSEQIDLIRMVFDERLNRLKRGNELPPGVIKMVKVYVAIKRKISVGDKMAGRHGNKGVVSRILAAEDMPYLADGTSVDIVLNPLGVPSRMNLGQILECHLGWAGKKLGADIADFVRDNSDISSIRKRIREMYGHTSAARFIESLPDEEILGVAGRLSKGVPIATPVFDGARESDIKEALSMAGLPVSGQSDLYDGRTGDKFDHKVTVGIMYMLKLHHLVDDKIHARSTGPYSLVTQQPLGGKAQFGGQRLGEMEVWAMEAYGAAYTLQEFLTVKSDDIPGRTRMYESIVKGDYSLEPNMPESFNVLIKELQSLVLDVQLLEKVNDDMERQS